MERPDTHTWDQRAAEAEAVVLRRFVGRHRGLPGTLLGRIVTSATQDGDRFVAGGNAPFHYWWQAHLLDALLDGGWRRLRGDDAAGARRSALFGHRLLATIRLRNRGTLRNHFYDDMAWLALAVDRLAALDDHLGLRLPRMTLAPARRTLARQLWRSRDSTGGVVWNRDRDFLNAATAGPVALHLARTGHVTQARTIIEWLFNHLLEPQRGLILDGLRCSGDLVADVYTYNQGTTLAALLALGAPQDLERAAVLVRAVGEHLSITSQGRRVLVTHGSGDGGLFTGILARYLSLVARDPRLPCDVRGEAAGLVRATAETLWGRRDAALGLFPSSADDAARPPGLGSRVELSTQLQAWMVLEAAALLDT